MKLYTEKEIRRTFGFGLNEIHFKGFMNAMTPILLPSDEDIEKEAFQVPYNGSNEFYDKSFIRGAKWVIEQIKKQK